MISQRTSGISPNRVDRLHETSLRTTGQQQRQVAQPQAASRPARVDQVGFSADALAMSRLSRMWGALSSLFGSGGATKAGPDLSGLRAALAQARKTAEAVELRQRVTDTLKSSALRQAELLVEKYYGLKGDGTTVRISYDSNTEGALASVSFQYDERGRMASPRLNINVNQFAPDAGPNGVNEHIIQNDRIVAHEMTHLIMGRNMDVSSLPDWFAEGAAEYISGGAERVALSLRHLSPQRLLNTLNKPWAGDSDSYAAGYLAVRFLDQTTSEAGGLKAVMGRLKAGDSLDAAIATVSQGQFADTDHFMQEFTTGGAGVAFLRSLDLTGRDPGSIKPASGRSVVADVGARVNQPLQGFRLEWPSALEGLSFAPAGVAFAYQRNMPGSGRPSGA